MTSPQIPISALMLKIDQSSIGFGNKLYPHICSGDAIFFRALFKEKDNLFLSNYSNAACQIVDKDNKHMALLVTITEIEDSVFGVVRVSGCDSIHLFKIIKSNTFFLVYIGDSRDYERNYLELLIQGSYDEILNRMPNN